MSHVAGIAGAPSAMASLVDLASPARRIMVAVLTPRNAFGQGLARFGAAGGWLPVE